VDITFRNSNIKAGQSARIAICFRISSASAFTTSLLS
jgi:hypothetical protein